MTFNFGPLSIGSASDQGEGDTRRISVRVDDTIQNQYGNTNTISTTKFTLLSWLPVSLLVQFKKIANVYFLVISILMLIGQYATYIFTTPLDAWSTVLTLVFVLLVTCFKEAWEDIQRYKSDRDENYRPATIVKWENGAFVEKIVNTCDIKAGDIVKLTGKSSVPVDMLLMLTSMHKDGNQCYIETANIDGETNLKVREAPARLLQMDEVKNGVPGINLFTGDIEFELPNKNIHGFNGRLELASIEEVPLDAQNILLRGSVFCNTDWCYGIAIYTGKETKVQMCNSEAATKECNLDKEVNSAIYIIFAAQVILVSISVISVYGLGFNNTGDLPYVFPPGSKRNSVLPLWLEQWFVFFILYNNFIPISLYVTIEIVNLGQSSLISGDQEIYQPDLDMPTTVRTSSLCQELGMVSNIFSDKTGTLTRNEMKFVQFYIDGKPYNINNDEANPVQKLIAAPESNPKLINFLKCLTTCHTVVREKDGTYRAESPDELALVEGVGAFNCRLLERGTVQMIVEFLGKKDDFDILAVNAFNADRKRMSVLLRENSTKSYYVYCKGADNIMLPLCNIKPDDLKVIDDNLREMAVQSLRTLCIAEKRMSEADAMKWLARYKEASASMTNRAELLAQAAADLESGMELLGLTAIEDRLQDQVPEVIAELARAGIVLWMLTGDKLETAVNIGKSCNLIVSDGSMDTMLHYISNIKTKEDFNTRLSDIYNDVSLKTSNNEHGYIDNGIRRDLVLVMDGPSYHYFDEENLDQRKWLLFIGKACRSVIGCRLTPKQKADLVSLVKHDSYPAATTLAIGDGANDVPMIQAGNVGVGIFGKEGRQAANNADFAIGEFKFLRRLLLVHGRWNYARQSRVFLYSMHKNMVITLTLFWFSYFTALSGTSPYESWIYTAFNFALGLPIVFYGIQDRDVSEKFVLANPSTYSTGKDNVYLRKSTVLGWILNACLYAILLCLLFYYTLRDSFQYLSIYEMGTTVFMGLVMALQGKIMFMHSQWTWIQFVIQLGTFFLLLMYYLSVDNVVSDFNGVAKTLLKEDIFWFYGFWSAPVFCTLIDVIYYYGVQACCPTREMLFRESEHKELFVNDAFLTEFSDYNIINGPTQPTAQTSTNSNNAENRV